MPRLRINSRPLIKCSYYSCPNYFRNWRRRKFCSDRCRKANWRVEHLDYYRQQQVEWLARKKIGRRQARKYVWVVEGEDQTPVRLRIEEALAQASPDAVREIEEKLGL